MFRSDAPEERGIVTVTLHRITANYYVYQGLFQGRVEIHYFHRERWQTPPKTLTFPVTP